VAVRVGLAAARASRQPCLSDGHHEAIPVRLSSTLRRRGCELR